MLGKRDMKEKEKQTNKQIDSVFLITDIKRNMFGLKECGVPGWISKNANTSCRRESEIQ